MDMGHALAQGRLSLPSSSTFIASKSIPMMRRHLLTAGTFMAYRADLVENLYHMMGEHSPSMHAAMCKHLGYCTYGQHRHKDDIRIIFMDVSNTQQPNPPPPPPPPLLACRQGLGLG